jgi:benzylsuccinate CoA-transferase BbsE subunit
MTSANATGAPAALEGVRVLDLTGTAGQYAGKLLADLGADVVRVEPPAGSPARTMPPFADDAPSPNKSLAFWYWNTSKRSITIDLSTEDGKALFRRLLPRYDILLHTYTPAQTAELGLAPQELAALHAGLIECSITPYGEWGPHAGWLGTDLTISAMSGLMTLAGYPDRAPSMPPGEQAAVCGGVQAAQGIMVALLARDRDGRGQRVEVSQQEAMSITQETAMQTWDMRHELRKRAGNQKLLPGFGTYECADGHIYCMIGVAGFGAPMPVLFDWMREEGVEGTESSGELLELLARTNLRELTALMTDPVKLQEFMQKAGALDSMIIKFFESKTKAELYIGGQSRRLLIGPVNSAKDLTEDLQLRARAWWQEVEHPEVGRTLTYPGPPYHHSETPWRISRRPPLLGEHTLEVLEGELELTREQTAILMGAGVI